MAIPKQVIRLRLNITNRELDLTRFLPSYSAVLVENKKLKNKLVVK